MLFVMDKPNNFRTVSKVHGIHTRSKNQLFVPNANLTSVQKGITYSGIKIYSSLSSSILSLQIQERSRSAGGDSAVSVDDYIGISDGCYRQMNSYKTLPS